MKSARVQVSGKYYATLSRYVRQYTNTSNFFQLNIKNIERLSYKNCIFMLWFNSIRSTFIWSMNCLMNVSLNIIEKYLWDTNKLAEKDWLTAFLKRNSKRLLENRNQQQNKRQCFLWQSGCTYAQVLISVFQDMEPWRDSRSNSVETG